MWTTYTGHDNFAVEYNIIPSASGYYSRFFPRNCTSCSDDFISSSGIIYTNDEYTINNGTVGWFTYDDSGVPHIVTDNLNVTGLLATTATSNQEYQIKSTEESSFISIIIAGDFTTEATYTDIVEKVVTHNIRITTTVNTITVTTAYSSENLANETIYYVPTGTTGYYMVAYPRISYPWTYDGITRKFLQTFGWDSYSRSSTFVYQGIETGGILNKEQENDEEWPKTIFQSATTINFDTWYAYQYFSPSVATLELAYEVTESIEFQSLELTTQTTSINSRYLYNSEVSKFFTEPSTSEAFQIYTTQATGSQYTLRNGLTVTNFYGTYVDYTSTSYSLENEDAVFYSAVTITQSIGLYYREQPILTTVPDTTSYTVINSGMSGAYYSSFSFTGLWKKTTYTTQIQNINYFSGTGITADIYTGQNGLELNGNIHITEHRFEPVFSYGSTQSYLGVDVEEVNRPYAFEGYYDQPPATYYTYSPNYNFAVGTTYEESAQEAQYLNHGGYFAKIQPESLLSVCWWSYYNFERRANINIPFLAYPLNTSYSDTASTIVQSADIPQSFLNGSGTASIYRTTSIYESENNASYTCCYAESESFKRMILNNMFLDDISAGVLASPSKIKGELQLAGTTMPEYYLPFSPNQYIGKTWYPNYEPIRHTIGFVEKPHSAIGPDFLVAQNLFTLIKTYIGGGAVFTFTSSEIAFENSFSMLQ
jgi:hypothetical protein